jgi:TPP-dependent pyruvate/acetoin dehydrogenase alpha subunit
MSLGILGANGVVAGGLGIATGAALSAKFLGDGRISVAFFGDGALNEGLFYEVANMASVWKLPVVYILENNRYGEYTAANRVTAGTGPARAEALEIPAVSVDGNDVIEVHQAADWAVTRARNGGGPSLVECMTYRWRGHHMGDQGNTYGYRSVEEVEKWRQKCPIERFRERLLKDNLSDRETLDKVKAEQKARISAAFEYGKNSPCPDPAQVIEDVYG